MARVPGWPWTHSVWKNDRELPILLHLPPECWNCRCDFPFLAYGFPEVKQALQPQPLPQFLRFCWFVGLLVLFCFLDSSIHSPDIDEKTGWKRARDEVWHEDMLWHGEAQLRVQPGIGVDTAAGLSWLPDSQIKYATIWFCRKTQDQRQAHWVANRQPSTQVLFHLPRYRLCSAVTGCVDTLCECYISTEKPSLKSQLSSHHSSHASPRPTSPSALPILAQFSPANDVDMDSCSCHNTLLKISGMEDILRQAGLSPGLIWPYKHMHVKCTMEVWTRLAVVNDLWSVRQILVRGFQRVQSVVLASVDSGPVE